MNVQGAKALAGKLVDVRRSDLNPTLRALRVIVSQATLLKGIGSEKAAELRSLASDIILATKPLDNYQLWLEQLRAVGRNIEKESDLLDRVIDPLSTGGRFLFSENGDVSGARVELAAIFAQPYLDETYGNCKIFHGENSDRFKMLKPVAQKALANALTGHYHEVFEDMSRDLLWDLQSTLEASGGRSPTNGKIFSLASSDEIRNLLLYIKEGLGKISADDHLLLGSDPTPVAQATQTHIGEINAALERLGSIR